MVRQNWLKRHHSLLLLIFLNILSLIFIFNDKSATETGFRSLLRDQLSSIRASFNYFEAVSTLKQENQRLLEKNTQLQFERDNLSEISLQNQRFRSFFNLAKLGRFEYKMAEVIGEDHNFSGSNLILNKGIQDSVTLNMAVVTPKGLIGRIVYLGSETSIVQLLTNKNIMVSCRSQRSRVLGTIAWSRGNSLELLYYPKTEPLKVGDVIITSGLSDIYPKGIRVGIVSKIDNPKYDIFKAVSVEPVVDFDVLEEVFIVGRRKSGEQ